MLENLKSLYFFSNKVFSYICEKKKLLIAKYNKNLQNTLHISLLNYKLFTGKSIIFEQGKVIEYDNFTNFIVFEVEYINGKKNREGKEYNNSGTLKFEGKYLNGKRNGYGKEYNVDGNFVVLDDDLGLKINGDILKFEGEFLNGNKFNGKGYDRDGNIVYELKNGNGHVKEYNNHNALTFEGKVKNGLRNGKGKEYGIFKTLLFEGEYLDGLRNGKGKEYYDNGNLMFEGEYLNGKRWEGKGYDIDKNIVYELKNGKGLIKDYYKNGHFMFEGEYLNGLKNGKGKEYDHEGKLVFEGEYLNGERTGKGKENHYPEEFVGEYLYGHKIKGKTFILGKLKFEGEYLYDREWSGKGYDASGNIIYELHNGYGIVKEYNKDNVKLEFEGEFINGLKNGIGREFYNDELIFEGEYLEGLRWNGKGKELIYGKVIFEGEYVNGEKKQIN